MSADAERLIRLAVQPIAGNAELQLAADGEVRRRIEECSASPDALAEAVESLERADRHPRRRVWRTALYLTTLAVSLPLLVQSIRQLAGFASIRAMISPFETVAGGHLKPLSQQPWQPGEKLLLFGDESAPNPAARWKPLWESEPQNPVFFARYAAGYFQTHPKLSPEILSDAARIDPDNGFHVALQAAGMVEDAVTRGKQSERDKREFKTPVWTITDPKGLEEILKLVHQAAAKPRLTGYAKELFRQRIPLLPKRNDCVSQMPALAYIAWEPSTGAAIRKLADALAAGAQHCAATGDVAGFQQLVADWESLGRKLVRDGLTMVDLLVAKVVLTGPAENFRDAAQTLRLDAEMKRFLAIHEMKISAKEARAKRIRDSNTDELITTRGSMFATLTLPMIESQVQSPPPLLEADLRPSRLAEHAMMLRGMSWFALLALAICAGLAALQRFRHSPLVRSLSNRMTDLLRPGDWARILIGGLLVPGLWYASIIWLTPLSSREWSVKTSGFLQISAQFGSMIVLMVVLSTVIASSRLAKRGAAIGLTVRFPWLGWLAAGCAFLALPVIGSVMFAAKSRSSIEWFSSYLTGLSGLLLAIPILWLLVGCCRNVFERHPHALRRATLARILLPTWVCGMLVIALGIPLHHANERHWIQRDYLFELNPDAPALSLYEWEVTQQLRKEVLEPIDRMTGLAE